MKVFVTGSAGFVGSAVTLALLARGDEVLGLDNHNDYYDPCLKEDRLKRHLNHQSYRHLRADVADSDAVHSAISDFRPDSVVHLAAQAGVRYSILNPSVYVRSNLVGFANILEACRSASVRHLVYASSSSVYGSRSRLPFSVGDRADHPVSLYAATKRSNELMSHAYSHLFGLPCTGLRFFTVYGPWGRPDMAFFKFTKAIIERRPIEVFNQGHHRRDFTYIDDIVEGVVRVIDKPPVSGAGATATGGSSGAPWRLYNIGHGFPVALMDYIGAIERAVGATATIQMLPLQAGDVEETAADVESLFADFNYRPTTTIDTGIQRFVTWYRQYYDV